MLFVVCTLIVIGYALVRTFQALKTGGGVNTETPARPAQLYSPAGLGSNPAERELVAQWDAYYAAHPDAHLIRTGH